MRWHGKHVHAPSSFCESNPPFFTVFYSKYLTVIPKTYKSVYTGKGFPNIQNWDKFIGFCRGLITIYNSVYKIAITIFFSPNQIYILSFINPFIKSYEVEGVIVPQLLLIISACFDVMFEHANYYVHGGFVVPLVTLSDNKWLLFFSFFALCQVPDQGFHKAYKSNPRLELRWTNFTVCRKHNGDDFVAICPEWTTFDRIIAIISITFDS